MSEELNNSEEIEQEAPQESEDDKAYDDVFFSDDGEVKEETPEPEDEPEDEKTDDAGDNPDEEPGEAPADEDQESEDTPEDAEELPEEQDAKEFTLKWRGQEIKATKEEVINMAQRNFDSTHKYQEASKLRKSVEKEMDLIEKIRGGDKTALAQLAKQAGVDPIDLIDVDVPDIEQGQPDQAEPFVSQEVANLMEEVAQDEPLYEELRNLEQILPETVVTAMAKDPQTFYSIVQEVRSGDANLVMPQVQAKLAQLDNVDRAVVLGNPDAYANFYINVKDSMIREANKQPEQKKQPKQNKNYAETSVKKSGNRQQRRGSEKADSFESDDAYEAILERLSNQ